MTATNTAGRWRDHLLPGQIVGQLLAKPWIDNAIPVLALAAVLILFGFVTPEFFAVASLFDLSRVLGEYQLIAVGTAIVMIAGGIDLSIGSNFALSNIVVLSLVYKLHIPVAASIPLAVLFGAAIGSINGVLIGYLRLRAFLTTLVVLIIVRAVVDMLLLSYVPSLLSSSDVNGEGLWDFLGDGQVFGIPSSFFFAVCVAILAHIFLTRSRLGWHILAVGGSRRAAFNAGIPVRRTVCLTYVISGALVGLGAFFYAARLQTAGNNTGVGMEFLVITGAVLGGISLGGGRGSIFRAVLGTLIVLIISNGMLRLGLASGGSSMMLGAILLLAIVFDIRWTKSRSKLLVKSRISPAHLVMPPLKAGSAGAGGPYATNDALRQATSIGLSEVEGPHDIILDEAGDLFCGTRRGEILRCFGPDYRHWEVLAHTGGYPLGLAFDAERDLLVCVAGIGLCKITRDREVINLSNQTKRSPLSIVDDSRVRLANGLDVARDGRIFYSDSTTRYELSDWLSEAIEMRPNGRIICYDPRDGKTRVVLSNLLFPSGVCIMDDGVSLLFSSTWECKIHRYWFDGPQRGRTEVFIEDLPGYPDGIARSSDGGYWCALVGLRSPTFDLSLAMPDMRRRMIDQVAPDSWLFPNTNAGCVLKFDANGKVVESLWDLKGDAHSHVTSVREHNGRLFIAGRRNNRIGVFDVRGADARWSEARSLRSVAS
jgi:ribose transport system permease protein